MNLYPLLAQFNLSETESHIYLALLKARHLSATEIAKNTELKRPTVYYGLEQLQEKGLVKTIGSGKIFRYRAESPQQLHTILERKKIEIKTKTKQLEKDLPFLHTFDEQAKQGLPHIEYFRGKEGIKNIAEKVFTARKKELFAITPSFTIVEQFLEDDYGLFYLKKRATEGIKTYTIWQDLPQSTQMIEHEK